MQKEIERKKHPSQVAQYIDSFLLFPLQCIFTLYLIYSSAENILQFLFEGADCGDFFFYYWFPGMSIHIFPFIDPSGVKDILSSAYLRLHLMRWWDGAGIIIGNWMAPWVRMKAMQDYTHICFFNSQFFFRAGKSNLYYTVMH